ncbi:UdgX family uracil-DNA binding protein [Nocardia caishijiensis]|uniref:Type-4 uracil-DNA glycosylase n=1 Tax=Nocardia caishijiensis TaxID=184756 RepID=A0ABQ6YIW0_9NOCA|nr:UdgX family uracil-DNA binding protein [Nocardia caishijiensis]KAF0845728.1 DNA polymerase [Nocardia caishijiensis]
MTTTKYPGAEEYVPSTGDLTAVAAAAEACHGCDLYRDATQTVFGAGAPHASTVLIGEQPGNEEDLDGHPFVGPAGRLLDRALDDIGVDRESLYLTNAVKHFRFERRGKRRIHQQPRRTEIVACAPWLTRELDLIAPELVICLGAIATHSVLGPKAKVTELRGRTVELEHFRVGATVHPSSVLRATDRTKAYAEFVDDLTNLFERA